MKTLYVTVMCTAIYESAIEVPDEMSLEDAIDYANDNIEDIPLGLLEYVPYDDEIIEENCHF